MEKPDFAKIDKQPGNMLLPKDIMTFWNKEIDKILSECEGEIKNIDNVNIVKIFQLSKTKFADLVDKKLQFNDFQLEILIDIMVRDGNSIMSRDWFNKLYSNEIAHLKKHLKTFLTQLDEDNQEITPQSKRDYITYRNCVSTGYENDLLQNREKLLQEMKNLF